MTTWSTTPPLLASGWQQPAGPSASSPIWSTPTTSSFWRRTARQLQRLIDALSSFCLSVGLDVSPGKTQVLVFHAAADAALPAFTFVGRTLPHADSYKYLGVTFTRSGCAGDGLSHLCSKTGLAYHKTRGKFARLGCGSDMHLQLHLFDACVTATATTSCEHWGVHPAAAAGRKKLETQHRRYIKRICGLPDSVSTGAMLAELDRAPLPNRWLSQSREWILEQHLRAARG